MSVSIVNPTAGDVHVNRPLTDFSQKYLQDTSRFIATRAFPQKPVQFQSDSYYVFNRADYYRDEVEERADGTESQGTGFRLSTDTYSAKVYAIHQDVTDRQRANADAGLNLDESATQNVMHKLLIKRERDFSDTFMASGSWDTAKAGVSGTPTASQFKSWDQSASDPIADVRLGIETVQGTTGFRPNKMTIGRPAFNTLMDNAAVLDRIEGGATSDQPAMVQKRLLAALFELDEIFVMESVYNSAVRGATESTGFINGDSALLYYAPNQLSLNEPSAGAAFNWTGWMGATSNGIRVKRFRQPESYEADRIEGQMAFDHKVTGSELGYFFSNIRA